MANQFFDQTILETNKIEVISLTATFDGTGQETANTKIQGRNLRGALAVDANNAVLVNNPANSAFNGVARTNYNYSVARIIYDVNIPNGYLVINFDGATPAKIWNAHGQFDMNFQFNMGVINNKAVSPNGNITFTTVGAGANNSYAVLIELHKGPNAANAACDFDMGAIRAPSDFNFGQFAVKP